MKMQIAYSVLITSYKNYSLVSNIDGEIICEILILRQGQTLLSLAKICIGFLFTLLDSLF